MSAKFLLGLKKMAPASKEDVKAVLKKSGHVLPAAIAFEADLLLPKRKTAKVQVGGVKAGSK